MSIEIIQGAVLLPDAPDWKTNVELDLRWRTEIVAGMTGLEDRAARRERPAATLTWRVSASGAAPAGLLAERVRRALEVGAAAAPCHSRPSACVAAAASALTIAPTPWPWAAGDWLLARGEARQITAAAGNVLTLAAPLVDLPAPGEAIHPLIFGRLEAEPDRRKAADAFAVRLRLHAPSWRIAEAAAPRVYRGLSVAPDLLAEGCVPLLGESELNAAESFLQRVGGRCDAFWLRAEQQTMIVTASAEGGFVISARGFAEDEGIDLWFAHATLPPMVARAASVSAGPIDGTELVLLEETLPAPVDASWDVFRLRLVRLDDDRVREVCEANGLTSLRWSVRDLPAESAAGERPRFLYRFQARREAAAVWTLTSHDQPVVCDGETYAPAAISHTEVTPGRITVESDLLPFPAGDVIDVTLRRLTAPGSVEPLFTGRVGAAQADGARWRTELSPPVDLANRSLPPFRVGAACNHRLFGAACGLNAASWAAAGTLGALNGAAVSLNADPGVAENWFAGGQLVTGDERRTILASDGASLLLSEPLLDAQPGDAVTVYPGCSHFAAQCQAKFGNLARFGGHPFVAERQPARTLPHVAGWRRLGTLEIAAPHDWTTDPDGGGYRADLALAVCRGPVDAVTHLWIDGRLAWTGRVSRSGTDGAALEIPGRGTATLYFGGADQAAAPALEALGHPGYVGQCYLWLPQFLVGPDPERLPRIEVALQRYPAIEWAGGPEANLEGDAHPLIALADSLIALGVDASLLDLAPWETLAPVGISPVLGEAPFLAALCEHADGFLHWTPEGKLRFFQRGPAPADVTGLPTLRDEHLTEPPRLAPAGAGFNRTVVTCLERDRGWTPDAAQWFDEGSFGASGEERAQTLTRPWVTRRAIAAGVARRAGLAAAFPGASGFLRVRRSAAVGIEAGDWFTLQLAGWTAPLVLQCLSRRTPRGAAPLVELEAAAGLPTDRFPGSLASDDVISRDPALPGI